MLWVGLTLSDYTALAREIARGTWPDRRGEAIAALEAQGHRVLWGDYRLAYVLTFRSQERLRVAALDGAHRIDDYARAAAAREAPLVKQEECAGGRPLVPTIWLCPSPPPNARPPVY